MRFSFLFLLLTLVAKVASAQGQTTMTVNLFGVNAQYAPPPWVMSATVLDEVEINRSEGPVSESTLGFILEYIPKGQNFEDWSELYAIFAELPLAGSAADYMQNTLSLYGSTCSDVAYLASNTTPQSTELFVVYCESYLDRPEIGEVGFFVYQKMGGMLVKNYYHRRVPAFEVDRSTGQISPQPFSDEDYVSWISALGRLSLVGRAPPLP